MKTSQPGRVLAALAGLSLLLAICGCGVTDPTARALEQRARWTVQLLDWAQTPEGTIHISTRVSGPSSSSIEQLTVRVQLYDAEENQIGTVWHSYDLAEAPRGGPADLTVSIPEFGSEVFGVYIDPVRAPSDEEQGHLVELGP